MRSPTSLTVVLALLAVGCGTWSNEDIRFLAALPTTEELRVELPAGLAAVAEASGAGPGVGRVAAVTLPWCAPNPTAETWLWAKPTSDRLNTSVDWVIGLVDVVRRYPPTTRAEDARTWGPFDDDQHPGVQLRVVIVRSWPAGPDGPVEHAYAFEARRKALGEPFTAILSGTFVGASSLRGRGGLLLAFDRIRALGMNDPDSPTGEMRVAYDRSADPRTTQLTLAQSPGFGLAQFDYGFEGYADGRGRLSYAFVNDAGDRVEVAAEWTPIGAGQADIRFYPASAGGASVGYHQCWDFRACLTYSDDVSGYSCGGGSCAFGAPSDCPPPLVP
jgi:hypothetical protein